MVTILSRFLQKQPLQFSYIGMKTQDIAVKGQSQINVTLSDDTQALDEVVVIGYGTVAKKDLTGSVSSVSAKQIAAIPVSSASEALQGKMAGVSITTTEGSPDADVKSAYVVAVLYLKIIHRFIL